MIEEIVLNFLSDRLPVPVCMKVPGKPPDIFAVLEKTGSGANDGVYSATLAVQSYGPDAADHDGTLDAARLNEAVKTAMLDADTLPEIVSCDLNTDYNFPDTTRKRPRYQAVFDVVHY